MGCTNSKLDNEDTVRRCKERRRLMKQAVHSRHHLAAAHSDYIRSLRLTGSALSIFAAGEPLSVSDETPPVLLRPPSSTSSAAAFAPPRPPSPSPPPPPPPPPFTTSSPPITSSKVPHILSDSSPSSTPSQKPFPRNPHFTKYPHLPTNSTYSSTPSQASSVWNWEDFYPPPPPGSDFFRRSEDGHVSDYNDDDRTEREEVHCSEWGDHYSTHSSSISSDNDDKTHLRENDDDAESRSEAATRSNFGSSVDNAAIPPSVIGEKFAKMEQSELGSSASGGASGMKMVVRHRDLAEIVKAIEEYFNKAADAGDAVSDLLEIGRAQFESSFRQLKKTVYHSNSMLSNISSTWTAKPPLAIRYRLDPDTQNSDPGKSHGSTLERLLAWEKKLYQEVKAREEVKIDHEKKLSLLQSQEYRGHDEAKQDKTKASINKLQSLILVTSQAVTTTSSSIIKLRDSELSMQLIELCYGFMHMWRAMNQFHEVQNNIVQQVRGLVNRSRAGESTSDLHRQATRDLEAAVSSWHSSFCRHVKYQRDYIRSLHGWLRLSLIQVDDQKDPSVTSDVSTSLFTFCDEWKQALDRLPDTVASEAIKSFVTVVHSISVKQSEEVKMRKRTESASKDLEKKAKSLRNIEKKFYQSYSMVGIGLPGDGGSDGSGQVFDTRDPLAEKKSEMEACRRRVEDEMLRHTKAMEATRAMTLNNIQTGLPGVFQAMTGFSSVFAEALELVCGRVGPI